mmetsp:Transcript_45482/g.140539  ORF Transcript_45482/g.140539 Transcript_45482/m.140539 type:complete len:83 (-) Transcript_45482:1484-1732(-)
MTSMRGGNATSILNMLNAALTCPAAEKSALETGVRDPGKPSAVPGAALQRDYRTCTEEPAFCVALARVALPASGVLPWEPAK